MDDHCYCLKTLMDSCRPPTRKISSVPASSMKKKSRMLSLHKSKEQHSHNFNVQTNSSFSRTSPKIIDTTMEFELEESTIKDEPMSPSSSCPPSPISGNYGLNLKMANMAALTNANLVFEHENGSLQLSTTPQGILKNQQIIVDDSGQSTQRIAIPKLNIKMEPQSSHVFGLPPTPPSSLPSDESEGNQSPEHHLTSPMSPSTISPSGTTTMANSTRRNNSSGSTQSATSPATSAQSGNCGYTSSSFRKAIYRPIIISKQLQHAKKSTHGTFVLTEAEKRIVLAEGFRVPTRLPLTTAEESFLKQILRKNRNKISAQESRRKKQQYMGELERKVEILVSKNSDYKKHIESLEDSNASLLNQLAKLQTLLNRQNARKA